MKSNGSNFNQIVIKRQHVIAVVFLCSILNTNQVVFAIDYKTTSQINYASENNITIKKISKFHSTKFESNSEQQSEYIQESEPAQIKPSSTVPKIVSRRPAVSIIIDDIGDRLKDGMRAVSIPAPYTYSFLPNTPFARKLATEAHNMNKEVMLHIPMEATNGKRLGPNGLTSSMSRAVFDKTLLDAFKSVPYISGFNNHMGSLLSSKKENMNWVMNFVSKQNSNLYFVDSRTTAKSVIVEMAKQKNIDVISRDSFIDYEVNKESITKQIHYLIKLAKKNGSAIGIAHPYPETLEVLENAWPLFYEAGVDLISVSDLITLNNKRELSEWRLSSSH